MKQMEMMKQWIPKIKDIGMFRLVILVLAGVVLLVVSLPGEEKQRTEQAEKYDVCRENEELEYYITNLEQRLEEILQQVQGIGCVEVMITPKSTKEKVALKDNPYNEADIKERDSNGGERESLERTGQEQTVMEQKGNGVEVPYVTKEYQPEIEGVIVIAQGADSQEIVTEINEAIKALFSVPAHKIKVMKMK